MPSTLCKVCEDLDLIALFQTQVQYEDRIALGTLQDITTKGHCPFCRIVVKALCREWGVTELVSPVRLADGSEINVELVTRRGDSDYPFPNEGYNTDAVAYAITFTTDGIPEYVTKTDLTDTCVVQLMLDSFAAVSRPLFTARLMKQNLDLALAKHWLVSCLQSHGTQCAPPSAEGASPRWVIDVARSRIVARPPHVHYLTLSYVWGKSNVNRQDYRSSYANLVRDPSDSSLAMPLPADLPSTIQDAITVTKALGERYVWVDALCILPDDGGTSEIGSMSEIYGNSKLTIVAASGHNADAGLPGIRPHSRSLAQSHEIVKGLNLSLSLPTLHTVLKAGPWAKRGWTYQEGILSQRCLILSESQVHWECGSTSHCESMQDLPNVHHVTRSVAKSSTAQLTNPFQEEQPSPFSAYAHVVRQFTARHLSYASDILHAVSGVFDAQNSYTFCWGLPKEDFAAALL